MGMARLGGLKFGVCLAWLLGLYALLGAAIMGLAAGVRALVGL